MLLLGRRYAHGVERSSCSCRPSARPCLSRHALTDAAPLRPSSPELNPIELGFRNVLDYTQEHMREAELRPYDVLQRAFASVSASHARSHFREMRDALSRM